ncbi:B12-binding domain-containing radical SAM protein [Caldivirga maquilingensis]|uniref:Radical SAM domain protein n=1 Tax=Caldivirga maquilingensis (strain ATCC 700844 / DSM 13496 / JCM 10307 / IC-167) TaxID=397948 RepID=A8MB41_CALMQ|nr:radical SAM protein [Caldivirga maquilingensis]ABW02670.1 Radical SAM domain protein [Caldivirga maquilingensis IC-167]
MKSGSSNYGYPIVLTSEIATASDTYGSSVVGFASAIPDDYFRKRIAHWFFNVSSDREGRVKRAPYGLAKVEASLLNYGFNRDDVIIASPYKLHKVIGPRTRIVGIYTMDALGLSYGSGILYWILKLADLPYRGMPYIARSFLEVIEHPAIKAHRDHIKLLVGGPAAWQLVDTGAWQKLGIDIVYEGSFENYGPMLFERILKGEDIRGRVVNSRPSSIEDVPTIVTPSIGGLVEVTRGCGRGCEFCTPTLNGMISSFPFEGHIDKEIIINIEKGGHKSITLHSEEFFRYGAKSIDPNPDKVKDLVVKAYKLIKRYGDEYRLHTDFTTAAVVVQAPDLVKFVGEYMNEGGEWSFIEMGIETGSPRLLNMLMVGKAKPFTPRQYPDIVEQAVGILNDNRWVVVGTMILNLPGERDEDVAASIELLDRLKKYRILTFPLPFIPMGALRRRDFTILDKMIDDPLRREFILKALIKSMEEAIRSVELIVGSMENIIAKFIVRRISLFAFNMVLSRYKAKLGQIGEYSEEFIRKLASAAWDLSKRPMSININEDS